MAVNRQKASVAQAERDIKALKLENAELKKELERVSSLYKQLTEEGPAENYEERRVNLLKSQVIQLERQVLIQSEALASRSGALLQVENNMQKVADQLRELLASEVKGPTVPIERSQLTTLIENTEAARIRLYKNIEHCGSEKLQHPVMYMGSFLKPGRGEETTLLHVCSGKLEHINLKQVAKLESKLFALQKQLQTLHQSISTVWSHDNQTSYLTNQHVALPINQRLSGQLAKCGKSLQECCQDLLVLSILTPAAPWPLLQRSINPDINIDTVISSLASFPKSKHPQVKSSLSALLKACNYSKQVSKLEAKACSEELKFHQAVYHLQMKYMESLFNAVREAYAAFEKSVQSLLCQPLQDILKEFSQLKTSASEDALKEFLKAFKIHAEQLESAVESLAVIQGDGQSEGEEALSQFGHEFLASVHNAAIECAKDRDALAQEIQEVKQMQEQHTKDELIIFKPRTQEEVKGEEAKKVGRKDSTDDKQDIEGEDRLDKQPANSTSASVSKTQSKPLDKSNNKSTIQNGVKNKSVTDKKRGLSLRNPSGTSQRQPARRNSDRETAMKPPTPTSRGIPTPTSRARASSTTRNTPTPPRSSSMSGISSHAKSKVAPGKSGVQTGSGIPKLSPRSGIPTGIPRASSIPSRLSQQGGDDAVGGGEGALSGSGENGGGVGHDDGNHPGDGR